MEKTEKLNFQAETKELLHLVIHSIYTHHEIFLRELLSNASDAIDKIKFKSLTDQNILEGNGDFKIKIDVDKENRKLTISDNGIGMTKKELIENIGTIAKSGSKEFIKKLKESKTKDVELIGQFGVGFYSAFMVAKEVDVITKAPKAKAWHWNSKGEAEFTISEATKKERGTDIILHIREGEEFDKYLDKSEIEMLVKKYSDYIRYPIIMEVEEDNQKKEKTLNSMVPLWERSKNEITKEEYIEFYKNIFHDWNEPLDIIHLKTEGILEYTALFFIPSELPFDFHTKDFKPGIKLYSKHVFIMDHCKELLPEYLYFVKGIVDSADFSLNISREILQKNSTLKKIGKHLEKKILATLETKLKNERENYEKWWQKFGTAIKNGIYMSPEKQENIKELLLFYSTNDENKMTTLKEYKERMKEEQKYIYYISAKSKEFANHLPQMEAIKEKGYEVLYLLDPVDEFILPIMHEYDGVEFKSLSSGEMEENKKEIKKEDQDILEAIKKALEGKIKEARVSSLLKTSPVCIVSGENGISLHTEELLAQHQNLPFKASRILEINDTHPIFSLLKNEYEKNQLSEKFKDYCEILYNQALLLEGLSIENPSQFTEKITKLMLETQK